MAMNSSMFKFSINVTNQILKNNSLLPRHFTNRALTVYYNNSSKKSKNFLQFPQCYFYVNIKNLYSSSKNAHSNEKWKGNLESDLLVNVADNIGRTVSNVKRNVLEAASDTDVNFIAPHIKPTFNLAAYADTSDVLKYFIKLGVEIGRWDDNKEVCANILSKDIENDINPYILFLCDHGIPIDTMGIWLTKNPYIFEQSLENLQIRINYLESRKFKKENITHIISSTPKWLNYNVIDIDRELGNFKKRFKLLNKEVIALATRDPKLILRIIDKPFNIERYYRIIDGQFGFTKKEQKALLLGFPRIYRTNLECLIRRFDIIRGELKLSHEVITTFPQIFGFRERKLQERHRFLKFLKKDQYDPTKPGYISPISFIGGSDAEFSTNVALSSVEIFNDFLKTM